jgi:hypothetical protein
MREEEDMPSQGIAQRGDSKPLYSWKERLHQKRGRGMDEHGAAMEQQQYRVP